MDTKCPRDDDFIREDDQSWCCGCDLNCAITTFGILSIITFLISIVVFIIACTLGAALASGEFSIEDLAKKVEKLAEGNASAEEIK